MYVFILINPRQYIFSIWPVNEWFSTDFHIIYAISFQIHVTMFDTVDSPAPFHIILIVSVISGNIVIILSVIIIKKCVFKKREYNAYLFPRSHSAYN